MNLTTIFIAFAGACAAWYVVTILLIYENPQRRGQRVSFLWLRVMAPWYASRYKEITRGECWFLVLPLGCFGKFCPAVCCIGSGNPFALI